MEAEMRAWLDRVDRLKQLRQQRPEFIIPELQVLDESSWFNAVQDKKLETEDQIRDTFARLRSDAENAFINKLTPALGAYLKANAGMLPTDPVQLAPFFDPPVEPAMLERYQMLHSGKYDDLPRADKNALLAAKAPLDVERDNYWVIGLHGFSSRGALGYDIEQARKAYATAHPGEKATEASQLLPHLKWPLDPAAVEKYLHGGAR